MSSHFHSLPFGAEPAGERGTRFRLWAPAARQVEVEFADRPAQRMRGCAEGVFEVEVHCAAGTRYRYRIDGAQSVPDPASRAQAEDVHGYSLVVDPRAFTWQHQHWRGRPWHESIVYEAHVGCFGGTFSGLIERLPHLASLGATALELMPIADFPGRRNWGYDGVLPYAPDAAY
ncbi:MAG: malto-oligosyltrehalose trehalohydrolase, partial [Nevskia sp.]|nr:malto-oligosyltrehalose trehalohydrolase [Nevskia sp.]